MISACETQDFVPFGRQHVTIHPGRAQAQINASNVVEHGLPIVKALKDFSLRETVKKDSWKLRTKKDGACDEELYINEHTVVWSCGSLGGAGKVIKSFTMDTPVQDAIWCSFLLPLDVPEKTSDANEEQGPPAVVQSAICILESGSVSIFSTDGRDYVTSLPFQVSKVWPVKNGLIFERVINEAVKEVSKTPKRDQQNLPVLFSMLHPLDEVAPVICRTGGSSSQAKVSFVTEASQRIVFSSCDPNLVMTYDQILGVHTIWAFRRAKQEEGYVACGMMDTFNTGSFNPHSNITTPGASYSGSLLSKLTISSQSPSLSPFRSYGSKLNSPVNGAGSKLNSPSISRLAAMSRSQSPLVGAASMYRYHTPSPHHWKSPAGFARTPISNTVSYADQSYATIVEPIVPEICLDHLWTESGNMISRDGVIGGATKAFLTKDLCGQKFLCYLISFRNQLRMVKLEESNDKSQLIFGALSNLSARDAAPLESLNMVVVLDMRSDLILYSGNIKINQIHVAGLPSPVSFSISGMHNHSLHPSTPFGSPFRFAGGPAFTSSRPPSAIDAKFDEEVQLLSPVPTEMNDSSQMIDSSLTDDLSFQNTNSVITSLRDANENRITLDLTDGSMFRIALPNMSSSPIVRTCLEAIRKVLPKDIAMQVVVKWYCTTNAPGSVNGQSEWIQFGRCLLGMMGYDVNKLPTPQEMEEESSMVSPEIAAKKSKPSDQGTDEDWECMLQSDHHKHFQESCDTLLGLRDVTNDNQGDSNEANIIDNSACLFQHMPALMFALHLVYEEFKVNTMYQGDLEELAHFLFLLACDLRCELYMDHYWRDQPQLLKIKPKPNIHEDLLNTMHYPSFLTKEPPSIYLWLCNYLKGIDNVPYPYLSEVNRNSKSVIALYLCFFEEELDEGVWTKHLKKISTAGHRTIPGDISMLKSCSSGENSNPYERVVLGTAELGLMLKDVLTCGVSLPLKEAIYHCRHNPPSNWTEEAYSLIGREDLAKQLRMDKQERIPPMKETASVSSKGVKEEEDGMEYLDKELLKLRYSDDLRIQEVRRLLQSSKPVRVALTQRPEVSDHEFIEEQERHLYATCIRTMALPLGRGMFTMSTYHPVPTETLPIPKLCLTGRAPPRNTTVDLTHIDTPPNMNSWPQFHNGVAAGLRIANSSQVDSTWIIYNKPKSNELNNEHAGFLMGLGLNRHLSALATLNVHDYLVRGHEMTSVGILLGVSAGKRGTMDEATTRLLSIHVSALLPPTSTELDVPHNVQVAAILGVGLVYQGTSHRHVAEVLLSEIGRPPGPEMENCTDRESYSLAAGLALGLVMLGKGSEAVGLSDLSMADQLYHYMVGGHKRPLTGANKERYKSPSYQIKEGDAVNVDVTSPGATLALGMMYFKTGNTAVAEWLVSPDTQFLLDFVRPDFLLLRIIAKGLVMWDYVHPSEEWLKTNIPAIVMKYAFRKQNFRDDPDCHIDFETMSQAYCNLVAGACMTLGLKFAGSANQQAFKCLYDKARTVLQLMTRQSYIEQAGKSTVENCFVTVVLSLAMIMAGTGDLEVLRLCRHLRSRVGSNYNHVLYGSHMAVSMAIGLLFLGGGRYTLSTKPEAVAAMLCAFFPKFPIHSNDNRYHLQAFRHLYVLASEPRVLSPKDVDSGKPCYVPIQIKFKNTVDYQDASYKTMAPGVLPELEQIQEISIEGPRYWPIHFNCSQNWSALRQMLQTGGYLYVKQRTGHLSYQEDPKGYHSVFSQSLTNDLSLGKLIKTEDIKSFSSDPRILAFAEHFCNSNVNEDFGTTQFLSNVLYECVSQEKTEILADYIAMDQIVKGLGSSASPLQLWQLKLICAFYERIKNRKRPHVNKQLISEEFLVSLKSRVGQKLQDWQETSPGVLAKYLMSQYTNGATPSSLASFLTWFDWPHPSQLALLGIQGAPSFAELYCQLQPFAMPIGSVMSLHKALQSQELISSTS